MYSTTFRKNIDLSALSMVWLSSVVNCMSFLGIQEKCKCLTAVYLSINWVKLKFKDLTNPFDIAVHAMKQVNSIIADQGQCAIWRMNLLSYKQVDKFISTQWRPWSLSAKSRRLLITPMDGDALFIYSDEGALVKRINLPRILVGNSRRGNNA
jgi:hypothetical protein